MPYISRFLLITLAAAAASSRGESLKLGCDDPSDAGREASAIRQRAAGVVQRLSKHKLTVVTQAKTLDFVDEPPFDEALAGLHHHFCDRREGFVLLRVYDGPLSTGILVNEATGAITSAGESVVFSEDRRAYFAEEQPDGLDGMHWRIYAVDGRPSWSGYNFIQPRSGELAADAYLSNPSWGPKGEFGAEAQCVRVLSAKWKVKLLKIDGEWNWHPRKPRC